MNLRGVVDIQFVQLFSCGEDGSDAFQAPYTDIREGWKIKQFTQRVGEQNHLCATAYNVWIAGKTNPALYTSYFQILSVWMVNL